MVLLVLKGDIGTAADMCLARNIEILVITQRVGGGLDPEVIITAPWSMLERVVQWFTETRDNAPPHRAGELLYYSPL